MTTWVALIRGINVGGRNSLPMAGLVSQLEKLQFVEIKTYIQSGNVVFRGPKAKSVAVAANIADAIEESYGFRPQVMVLDSEEFLAAVGGNPFGERAEEGDGRL